MTLICFLNFAMHIGFQVLTFLKSGCISQMKNTVNRVFQPPQTLLTKFKANIK